MNLTVPDQRVLRGAAATLRFLNTDAEGKATDPAGVVTVGVTRADGTEVLPPGTATVAGGAGTGLRTVALTAAQTAALDVLTATWTDAGDASVHTTIVEVVGGFLFTVAQARTDSTLADDTKYSDEDVIDTRLVCEAEAEDILDFATTPRFARVTLDGTGERAIYLPANFLRRVVAVSIDGTALGVDAVAALEVGEHRVVYRPAGYTWDVGRSNIVVAFEHGVSTAAPDIRKAAIRRCRHWINSDKSMVPDRSESYTDAAGNTYRMTRPSAWKTGDAMVDAVYARHSLRVDPNTDTSGPRPASRQLQFDPQHYSLYHGNRF
jgi:hypothetical protein